MCLRHVIFLIAGSHHGIFFMPWVRTIVATEKPTARKPCRGYQLSLVADELAAATGENEGATSQTHPLLLAATGGSPSYATTLRRHGATAHSFAGGSRLNAREGAINLDVDAGNGGRVSEKSLTERSVCVRNTGLG